MHNNLYSKDPFGVFTHTASSGGLGNLPPQNYPEEPPKSSSFWWKILVFFLLIIGFGLILYFKDTLVEGFKKMVSGVNDKVNPELKTEPIIEETKPETKLLTESVEPKIERLFLLADKADWDIQYINQKQEEHKAIYAEGKGWTIFE